MDYPSYVKLHERGLLEDRAGVALAHLSHCRMCPRHCGIDRTTERSLVCRTGRYARVSSYVPHFGEEDCLRGRCGSGTIFFSGCNLRCVFCQNSEISQGDDGDEVSAERLAGMMLELQEMGCHNINLVTPSHVVAQILESLLIATSRGLRLPLVYNSGGYESELELRLLDGVVDIYMPDLKLLAPEAAGRYLKAADYPTIVRAALIEMHRQVGVLQFEPDGLARRGVLVRHLIMPERQVDTGEAMRFLATEISPDTYVNLLGQYWPTGKSGRYPEIDRRIRPAEVNQAVATARKAGLHRFDSRA